MTLNEMKTYCTGLPGVTEEFPFDEVTVVFKVKGKMFALTDITEFSYINLKCDPDDALALRAMFPGVTPGYHMNKQHWNSVATDGSIEDDLIERWIDESYDLVVKKLPKRIRETLLSGKI